jgi:hypothetical protein
VVFSSFFGLSTVDELWDYLVFTKNPEQFLARDITMKMLHQML